MLYIYKHIIIIIIIESLKKILSLRYHISMHRIRFKSIIYNFLGGTICLISVLDTSGFRISIIFVKHDVFFWYLLHSDKNIRYSVGNEKMKFGYLWSLFLAGKIVDLKWSLYGGSVRKTEAGREDWRGLSMSGTSPSGAWAIKWGQEGHSVPDDSSKSVLNKVNYLVKLSYVLSDLWHWEPTQYRNELTQRPEDRKTQSTDCCIKIVFRNTKLSWNIWCVAL